MFLFSCFACDEGFLILAYMVVLVAISVFGCTVIAFGRRRHGCLDSPPPPPPPSLPRHVLTGSDQGIAESATTTTTITTTMNQALNDYIIDEKTTSDKSSTSRASSLFRDDFHRYENVARRNEPTATGYLVPDFERLNNSNKGSKRRAARRSRSRSEKEPTWIHAGNFKRRTSQEIFFFTWRDAGLVRRNRHHLI